VDVTKVENGTQDYGANNNDRKGQLIHGKLGDSIGGRLVQRGIENGAGVENVIAQVHSLGIEGHGQEGVDDRLLLPAIARDQPRLDEGKLQLTWVRKQLSNA
jgi:hypothetical protein